MDNRADKVDVEDGKQVYQMKDDCEGEEPSPT
jgi:hypothetical protein